MPPRTRTICTLCWARASPRRRRWGALRRRGAGTSGWAFAGQDFDWQLQARCGRFGLLGVTADWRASHAVQLRVQADCRGRTFAKPAASAGSGLTRALDGTPVARIACEVLVALACYSFAWVVGFGLVVGARPELAPSYFMTGWSFSGLEYPSFVWLVAWPLFFVTYAVVRLFWWRRSRSRSRAV